jgi:hypothetical protein
MPASTKSESGMSVSSTWKGMLITHAVRGVDVSRCVTVRMVDVRGERLFVFACACAQIGNWWEEARVSRGERGEEGAGRTEMGKHSAMTRLGDQVSTTGSTRLVVHLYGRGPLTFTPEYIFEKDSRVEIFVVPTGTGDCGINATEIKLGLRIASQ